MIKRTICICILLLFIMPSMTFAIENDYVDLSVTYSFERPVVKEIRIDDNIYDQVILQDNPSIGNVGEPSLPARGANILLPQKTKVDKVTVTAGKKTCLGAGYNIVPVGESVPLSMIDSASSPVPDETVYGSEDLFPGKLFTIVGTYGFRGYNILVLMLHPVQYVPSTGELFYYSDLTISVETKHDNVNDLFRGLEQDKQKVTMNVDNPVVADTYKTGVASLDDDYDLLILTTEELKEGFEPLKNAHDADGVRTTIKTLSDVGGGTPLDVRDYIRYFYTDMGIEYVLIGGDSNVFPTRYLYVLAYPGGYEDNMPSDLYYACLDGTYNYDGDDRWGEPNDGENGIDVDLWADVYVGRACVGDSNEVEHFVNKTIAYMNRNITDGYLNDVLMVGEYLGFGGISDWGGNCMDQLIDGSHADGYTTVGMPSDGFDITKLYDRDWPNNYWPKSEIMSKINDNVHIINHLGHSDYDKVMKMFSTDVNSLINSKFCFIYSQGCNAGGFDNGDCVAEHFNVKTNHGAYAVIMNARYGFGRSESTDGASHRYHREFWDAAFNENISKISECNHDSKHDNIWRINQNAMRWCCYELNLFGDPTLNIIPEPDPLPTIEIGNITGGFFSIGIEIKNTGDCDVTDICWNVSVKGGILGRINVFKEGNIPTIEIGDTYVIKTKAWIFGFGTIVVTVTVECNMGSSDTENANGWQIIVFTLIK